jgi:hypothetical protein
MPETLSFESYQTCLTISKSVQCKINIMTGNGNLVKKLVCVDPQLVEFYNIVVP